ncbi:Glycyl-tRNA synthetase beta subunit [Candidatus Electrothrix aarhusensis]|uniref:glycine--tRNA ligase n=1 Tax=Candidatus Electrothrix aarhusensis TaxID=1859131 RepID=A0A444J1V5_9BACT|nr:Glycyl-tRNA synthetase beta subunit [Candidatus Electrothrix aarhusensis]
MEDLQIIETKKGEYLMAVEEIKGQKTGELLPALLDELLHSIPFPKSMRWAESSMTFARPLQWILALYDGKVVDLTIEGVRTGATTSGTVLWIQSRWRFAILIIIRKYCWPNL